jgi:hypothetical protein
VTQHSTLSPERWAEFNLDQQILMIGTEMHRAAKLMRPQDDRLLKHCYERVLRLVDLTVEVNPRPTLCRELLRWRDLIAELYISPEPDADRHAAAFRVLLLFTPVAAQQIPYVLNQPSPSDSG